MAESRSEKRGSNRGGAAGEESARPGGAGPPGKSGKDGAVGGTAGASKERPAKSRRRTKLRYTRIPVFESADLTQRRLAMMEARSGAAGPLVWLTAGIHGDEVGGIVVVQEIFRRLRKSPLVRGRLAAFPLLNPFGFESATRQIPSTEEDLNRAFPGDPKGTFAERIAHLVHARIVGDAPELVLDLHNDWIRSIPYALIDPRPTSEVGRTAHRRLRELAKLTGFVAVDEQEEGVSRAALRSTLSGSLLEEGIAALTLELGAAQVVDEHNVAAGVRAVWRLLASLEMVEPTEPESAYPGIPARYRGRVLRYSHRPVPSTSGLVRFAVAPGDTVHEGSKLASVENVFGRTIEVLRATGDAVVLGHADSSLAVPGVPLVALAMHRARPSREPTDTSSVRAPAGSRPGRSQEE